MTDNDDQDQDENLTDDELLNQLREYADDLGEAPIVLIGEVQRRGIQCLDADPELQAKVQEVLDASREAGRKLLQQIAPQLYKDQHGLLHAFRDQSKGLTSELFGSMGEPPEIKGLVQRPEFDWDEIDRQLEENGPVALHGELINTLELGFGAIREELASQRRTLDEQRDAQADMRNSLATLESNAPGKEASHVLLWAAIVAAIAGVVSIVIAIVK